MAEFLLMIALVFSVLAKDTSAQCTSELSISISNVSPGAGAFVQFTCNVSSANFDRASWYQGETILVMGVNQLVNNSRLFLPGEVDIGDDCFNYGMGIVGISPEDAGEYTCRIGNETSTSMALEVIVTPDSMYPTCHAELNIGASVDDDSTVALSCRTLTGNPPWLPTWTSSAPGGSENISTSGDFTTSLLELPATLEVLGESTFNCFAACNSSHVNCLSSETRSCSIEGLFSATPMEQSINAGFSANYTCKTSIRNATVLWIIPNELQMSTDVNIDCSVNNTSCDLILTNTNPSINGSQIPCTLSKVGSNIIVLAKSVTIIVNPESTTPVPTTKVETVATTVPTASTSQQPSTTLLITPPPPSPPTPPFVPTTTTTPRPPTSTTPRPATTPISPTTSHTTVVPTTLPTTMLTTNRTPTMSRTSSQGLSSTLIPTGSSTNASVIAPTPGSGGNRSSGVGVGEIIAIVVTISILLIVLIVIFTCVLVRRNASLEKRGRLRRDAAMLDSQAPSPFNAYDMQTVLGGKDTQEMSRENQEKPDIDDSMGYLLPIPDLDADADTVDDSSFDNPAFDKDSALYASIPSKSNSVNEKYYQNTGPPSDDRYQNGSIDQGYYEHYPDPDLGGNSRIVHGIISTTL